MPPVADTLRVTGFVMVDGAVAVADQVQQQLESLGLHRDRLTSQPQLPAVRVEHAVTESINL